MNREEFKQWLKNHPGFNRMQNLQEENNSLKKEIELCYKKLEGLDEIIDMLKADNERLRKTAERYRLIAVECRRQRDDWRTESERRYTRQPEIDVLKAENYLLRKDAERYRWLRDKGFQHANVDLGEDIDGDPFVEFKPVMRIPEFVPYEDSDWTASQIDEALDAAMKEKKCTYQKD